MKNLWNEAEASSYTDNLLQLRVYSSRLLGGDPSLVLHGGGNTSVKMTIQNLFGDDVDVLYVKGSGWDLGTIEEPGFAPVRLETLLRMAELDALSDTEMVKNQRAAMLEPNAPNPSVEAILHAIIPFTFVDHTHADAVVTITNTPSGEEFIRDLYGPNMLIVPYMMPGFILARTIHEMTRDIDWQQLDGMILLNHGLFTFAHDAKASYDQHIEIVNQAEDYLTQYTGKAFAMTAANQPEQHELVAADLMTLTQLRKAVSQKRGQAVLAVPDTASETVTFSNLSNMSKLATRGLLTPDHVIRTKRIPIVLRDDIDQDSALTESVEQYAADYQAYFEQHADDTLTMLDPAPRWAVWRGRGSVAFGATLKEAAIINDIKRHTLRAIQVAEALEQWEVLGAREIFEIEYWELEQAKLKRGGQAPTLQGKVALVTGAASGIGRACVEALIGQGAAVTALDIQPLITEQFADQDVLGITCDVTDSEAVQQSIAKTIHQFGGLDIVISNAGLFPSSQTIADMGADMWERSLSLNLTSHQRLLQSCIPYLTNGIEPAVVIIASKNVPAPGPGAGAYSVAKAGLTQLGRVAALELGKAGIRVNMLHPNAVFDTALWTPELLAKRATNYGISVEEYKTNNLLGVEVRSQDVAALACAMVGPLFSRTTGAQVPIDGGNDRVV
ncbi:bifunctional aldolase/short-chain dehydrogenase [Chloroflexi bacterium TSY]|nr:bifunctional aldolase/short-chain dehydrogenase [Chloroflexi bacterium TSY]